MKKDATIKKTKSSLKPKVVKPNLFKDVKSLIHQQWKYLVRLMCINHEEPICTNDILN